jgi:DsbC/DsbD-like thiol-disulfide interchange protein
LRKLFLLACLLLVAACSKPAVNKEPAQVSSTSVVKITPEETTLAKNTSGDAVVRLKVQDGYHVNANPASFSYLIPTELKVTPASDVSVDFITYPDPVTRTFSFADEPLKVYEGDTMVKARLKAAPSAETGRHNLSALLRVQACNDQVCYPPGQIEVTIPVTIK